MGILGDFTSYRVTQGSSNSRDIFLDARDYKKFLQIMADVKKRCPVRIYGYCLLRKSIDLVIQPPGHVLLNRFLREVKAQYNVFFSARHAEDGDALSKHVRTVPLITDIELIKSITEVEFLPVRHYFAQSPGNYPYSSFSFRANLMAINEPSTLLESVSMIN